MIFKTKIYGWLTISFFIILILWPIQSAKAENNKKNHETKQRLEKIGKIENEEEKEDEEISTVQDIFDKKIRLNGSIESNYEHLDLKDIDNEDSVNSSDFFFSSVALELGIVFNEWSETKIVAELEDVGKDESDAKVCLDEAIVTLKSSRAPLYFIGGKTVMPFGVFKDHLIEGTLTEDIYEIDQWGATIGFAPEFYGLDISFSIYRNPNVIENIRDFDIHEFRPGRQKADKFRSYIANVALEPFKDTLFVNVFYNSEPGDGNRNQSIGGALAFHFRKLILDAEFITALERENGENEEENKERAGVVGLAIDLLDSLQLAMRYEVFDDDNPGDQDGVLYYRFIAGFNYSLMDVFDLPFLEDAIFSFEYRFSKYEKEADSEAADSQNMLQFQLALEF